MAAPALPSERRQRFQSLRGSDIQPMSRLFHTYRLIFEL
jgi:hypothetical protein